MRIFVVAWFPAALAGSLLILGGLVFALAP